MRSIKYLFFLLVFLSACKTEKKTVFTESGLNPENFKMEVDGKHTDLFVLRNSNNMEVCVTNFGGRIVSVMVPDKNGVMRDVVLGFDSIVDYMKYPTDFGATIGRYANRIKQGRFVLDDKEYILPKNNFGHCLHGGAKGFQYQIFDAKQISETELLLSYTSKDGEEGFPGNLRCDVNMKVSDDNSIEITYKAETDSPTIVNMTNHSYFNLDGNPSCDNSDYKLTLNSDYFTPIDSTFMTTGEISAVENTPMDFRISKSLSEAYSQNDIQINYANGLDHNWILNTKGDISIPCAELFSKKTGISLSVYTNEPGIQIYSGNFLDGTLKGKKGISYGFRSAVCLETQHYPDSPNKKNWPSVVLRPGDIYESKCIYKFSYK